MNRTKTHRGRRDLRARRHRHDRHGRSLVTSAKIADGTIMNRDIHRGTISESRLDAARRREAEPAPGGRGPGAAHTGATGVSAAPGCPRPPPASGATTGTRVVAGQDGGRGRRRERTCQATLNPAVAVTASGSLPPSRPLRDVAPPAANADRRRTAPRGGFDGSTIAVGIGMRAGPSTPRCRTPLRAVLHVLASSARPSRRRRPRSPRLARRREHAGSETGAFVNLVCRAYRSNGGTTSAGQDLRRVDRPVVDPRCRRSPDVAVAPQALRRASRSTRRARTPHRLDLLDRQRSGIGARSRSTSAMARGQPRRRLRHACPSDRYASRRLDAAPGSNDWAELRPNVRRSSCPPLAIGAPCHHVAELAPRRETATWLPARARALDHQVEPPSDLVLASGELGDAALAGRASGRFVAAHPHELHVDRGALDRVGRAERLRGADRELRDQRGELPSSSASETRAARGGPGDAARHASSRRP